MDKVQHAIVETVGALDASGGFRYGSHPACRWRPNTEHHIHVPGPGYGLSLREIFCRLAMGALCTGWRVTVLDPGTRHQWLQYLPRVNYIDDVEHAAAYSWLLTESSTDDDSASTLVIIPDYSDLRTPGSYGQRHELPDLKSDAQVGHGAPHIALGLGSSATPTPGWRTTLLSHWEPTTTTL
jgi:hypothetical protein